MSFRQSITEPAIVVTRNTLITWKVKYLPRREGVGNGVAALSLFYKSVLTTIISTRRRAEGIVKGGETAE